MKWFSRKKEEKVSDIVDAFNALETLDTRIIEMEKRFNERLDEIHKDINELTNEKMSTRRNLGLIWAQLGKVKGHATELEDVITGEDMQLRRDEYDVEPFH